MKILFAGTPEFASQSLQALLENQHQIVAVLTQPDRPSGRGRKLTPSSVKKLAEAHGIQVFQPLALNNHTAQQLIESFDVNVMVVVAYGLILPKTILDIPKHGCLNIHASLLPRWRGAAPIQRAIEAGDKQTGISIMQMDIGLDTGDVVAKQTLAIDQMDTSSSLHDKLANLGAQMIVSTLNQLAQGKLTHKTQDESLVTYADKLHRNESMIDWTKSAINIVHRIHAFNPWPGAKTTHGAVQLKLLKAKAFELKTNKQPGDLIVDDKQIIVQAGRGQVQILELQKPGGKPMQAQEFLNGYRLETGNRLN